MGQCYDIRMKAKFKDEAGAADALRKKIARGDQERTLYNVDHYAEIGIGLDKLGDLLKIFFGGWEGNFGPSEDFEGEMDSGYGFNASYGWEGVMMEAFDEMAPYLEDGSTIKIYPDSGVDKATIKGGKAIWR